MTTKPCLGLGEETIGDLLPKRQRETLRVFSRVRADVVRVVLKVAYGAELLRPSSWSPMAKPTG